MVQIRLTNTKTRRKEAFEPIDPSDVRMYVCGPTVYDRAHLGNARPVVVFDVLFRLLRHVYGEDHVTYVRNFTDVDDKINSRAAEAGRPIRDITDQTIGWFHEDMDALGALRPTKEPRATEWIGAMVAMIESLLSRGHAYEAEGHVLFRVRSYAAYGALSGRSVDDMIAGARVEVAPFKEDPLDFVLWKPSTDDLPGWGSPWGRGRPGWHIECSAMARELLGTSFDIHGGGLDLQFPHHENEIAQSVCAHPGEEFAKVWMHNEMLLVDGKKMAKSAGNFFTVRDLLDQGVRGEVIRLVLLGTHYRKPMDWTESKAEVAQATLWKWRRMCQGATQTAVASDELVGALADDLNTASALAALFKLADAGDWGTLKASASLLGFDLEGGAPDHQNTETHDDDRLQPVGLSVTPTLGRPVVQDRGDFAFRIQSLVDRRNAARSLRDFKLADEIREALTAAGIEVNDNGGTTSWSFGPTFDPSHLKGER